MSGGWGTKSWPVSPLPPLSSSLSPPLFYLLMKHNPLQSTRTGIYHGLGFFCLAQHSGCSLILQASVTPSVSPSGWIWTFFLHLCSFLFFSSYSCRNSLFLILLCSSLCLSTAMTKGTTNRSDFTLCFTIHHYQPCAHLLRMFFRKLSTGRLAVWDSPWMMHYICCYTGLTVALEMSNHRNVPRVG